MLRPLILLIFLFSGTAQAQVETLPTPISSGEILYQAADLFRSTPTPQSDGRIIYIVQTGDTLVGIATRFGYTVEQLDELYELNNMQQDDLLRVGQALVLGADQGAVVLLEGNIPPRYEGATHRESDNAFVHRVQAGETLIDIALKYGYRTMSDFYAVSGLSAESLLSTNQEVIVGFKPIPQQQGGSTDLPTSTPLPTPTPSNTPTPTPTPSATPLPFPTLAPTNTLLPPVELTETEEICEGSDCGTTAASAPLMSLLVPMIGIIATLLIISAAGWQWWAARN